jgi:diacylglycerol kinase family enzyme
VTPRAQVLVQQLLASSHDVELAETTRRGHATRLAERAATRGLDLVAVLGGDGTVNEGANGLIGSDTALAALPGGSTNVFCRTLGLPDDPVDATSATVAALAEDRIRRVGVGSANGRHFLFHAGVGFDAAVVEAVERRGELKRWLNHPLFAWAAVTTWISGYDRSQPHFRVAFEDQIVADGYLTICLNTDPYTYLGSRPFTLSPEADLDAPLSVITLRSLRLDKLLGVVTKALGGHDGLRSAGAVSYHTGVKEVTITSDEPFPYQVDGDFLGRVRTLRFAHHPDALRLVVP